jgi:hypothetical protein
MRALGGGGQKKSIIKDWGGVSKKMNKMRWSLDFRRDE